MELLNSFLNGLEKIDKSNLKKNFKLPIELLENKYKIDTNIIDDLELTVNSFIKKLFPLNKLTYDPQCL